MLGEYRHLGNKKASSMDQVSEWWEVILVYHSGLILGLRQTNKRRRYKVTPSLIGWAQT